LLTYRTSSNKFIKDNNIDIAGAPHKDFWNTLSYNDFVNGNVPNVTDPNTKQPITILTKGNGAESNIVYALSGAAGTQWDPNNPAGFGQMPVGGPYFSCIQIVELADWITRGCPNSGA
jgi:hypothetical protein